MRCDNCLWYPMQENETKGVDTRICSNCGHTQLESPNQMLIHNIYENKLMSEECFTNWNNEREYRLSDKIYHNY